MSQKTWKLLGLIMTFLMMTLLGGCSAGDKAAGEKKELVFANFRDIRDLNPHLYSGEMWAQNMLYESLVMNTETGVAPWLAEKWDISADGKVYDFHLRKDVSFSDGEKFNAQAAKLNIDAILDNRDRHTWLEMVRLIDRVEVVDEYTLRFVLKSPYYPMLTELAVTRPFRFISPKSMKDGQTKNGVTAYVGTGPWVLTEHKTDQYAVFTVNPRYWGAKPKIEKVTMKVIPDNQTRVLALQKGEIDLIFGKNMIDADSFTQLGKDNKFEAVMSQPSSTRMLLMNTTSGPLQDLRVRQALEHSINKQGISANIFNGSESVADTLLAKTVPYCNIDLKPFAYDVSQAERLLEEAGWQKAAGQKYRQKDGQSLLIKTHYNSNSALEKTISEYIQSELAKVGVNLEIVGEEEQAYRDRQKAGNFDIIFNISWGTPYDPQSSLAGMKLPVYGDYYAQQGLKDKKALDQAITDVLISTDETKRQNLYTYILTTLHDEAVYIPLTYERNRAVYTKNLKGVTFNPSQYDIPFEKMYFGQ
ncbi:nickel ABC transporter substrate-binding protein [Sporomusa sphaeroides]|uniref:nickel ABC transporter substrate-binding protein n=1 Tax=Sporomusa sphaeroides TaxID=47679 RepID=UPI002BE5704F|nr:nickel ABC transporter substrate-binding protein [Sporomusa sphaeroides]HML31810.1 nickel ABC transporter substrate-binding protein [Sporomusa sphaeroides]